MSRILIKGGHCVDPVTGLDGVGDLYLVDGRLAPVPQGTLATDRTIDARGLAVMPGLIDIHVHFREPGHEEAETIASGAMAAVAGGFTTVCCMPNTSPALDNEAAAEYVFLQAERAGAANVFPIGAVTKGRAGVELAELGQLAREGAVAFSDDGAPVMNAEVMRRALQYSAMFDKPIIDHCEDCHLSCGGVMNEGVVSTTLGLPGWPRVAEDVMVARDIMLAQETGGHVHIAHISTARSVELVREGKARGVRVTAEVTPHHLVLTDELVRTFDPVYRMNPPLRTQEDVEACRAGLKDGTIDCIASDHAPHAPETKTRPFPEAPFGVIGLESTVPVMVTTLLKSGILTLPELVDRMACAPARVLGLNKGTLAMGADADITLVDLDREFVLNADDFHSKSRNCPFAGQSWFGKVAATIVGGKVFEFGD
ncbi:MAG: dihydroorotase [Planctomycetota bacterium]|jgi:dihydroorotase